VGIEIFMREGSKGESYRAKKKGWAEERRR
jgi:hypothetical protein